MMLGSLRMHKGIIRMNEDAEKYLDQTINKENRFEEPSANIAGQLLTRVLY